MKLDINRIGATASDMVITPGESLGKQKPGPEGETDKVTSEQEGEING